MKKLLCLIFLTVLSRSEGLIPPSVDWRTSGAVSTVKSEGRCESSWAFGTIAAVEGVLKIKNGGPLTSLSAQELIDCDEMNKGCRGGDIAYAFDYILRNGVAKEDDYPYTAKDGKCLNKTKQHGAKIKGFISVPPTEQNLLKVLAQQPVTVAIATTENFINYKGGIVGGGQCGSPGIELTFNHVVTLIGYGGTGDDGYWLIKNSYGTGWGEKGYMRVKRPATCGFVMVGAFYPTV